MIGKLRNFWRVEVEIGREVGRKRMRLGFEENGWSWEMGVMKMRELGEGGFEIERKERREGVREMKGSRVKQGR